MGRVGVENLCKYQAERLILHLSPEWPSRKISTCGPWAIHHLWPVDSSWISRDGFKVWW